MLKYLNTMDHYSIVMNMDIYGYLTAWEFLNFYLLHLRHLGALEQKSSLIENWIPGNCYFFNVD